jgi:hypothetical protein
MKRGFVLALLAMGLAAACGGGGGDEGGGEGGGEEAAGEACGPAPAKMIGVPKLPQGFPTPEGVTYTGEEDAGPSHIVDGYREGSIEDAFEGYKEAFPDAGYDVTKDEKEEDDAEVNFEGGSSTGQVKLIQECSDRTSVKITIRPE